MSWIFEEINTRHLVSNFKCKRNSQKVYIKKWALTNHISNISKTTVVVDPSNRENVIAFYTLNAAQIEFETLSDTEKSKLPAYPIPAIRICQIAVDRGHIRKGLGTKMILHIFNQVINILPVIGVYLIILDVEKDNQEAISFYEGLGFKLLPDMDSDKYMVYGFKVEQVVATINQL